LYRFALALSAGIKRKKCNPAAALINCHYVDHRNSRHGPASVHEIALGELPAPVPGMSGPVQPLVGAMPTLGPALLAQNTVLSGNPERVSLKK
jgi:hypothetical protein